MNGEINRELAREHRRICPPAGDTSGITLVGLDPAIVLKELRGVADGAGELALAEAIDRAIRRQYPDGPGASA
jgi:hypothetical protein